MTAHALHFSGNVTGIEKAMENRPVHHTSNARVARHRIKAAAAGTARVEVSVPSEDVGLVKAMAGTLRRGGTAAVELRDILAATVSSPRAKTGADLVAFLRASPVRDVDFVVERDRSPGRAVDLE